MIIFKDILTGDEMFSDAYSPKLINDVIYEVECKMVTIRKGADVDIGANASAEGGEEELEDGSEIVNNVIHGFRLNQVMVDLTTYKGHIKEYITKIKAHLESSGSSPEQTREWLKNVQEYLKNIVPKKSFPDWEQYTGETYGIQGMIALLNYREDGVTPYLIFWKHGLKEEKV